MLWPMRSHERHTCPLTRSSLLTTAELKRRGRSRTPLAGVVGILAARSKMPGAAARQGGAGTLPHRRCARRLHCSTRRAGGNQRRRGRREQPTSHASAIAAKARVLGSGTAVVPPAPLPVVVQLAEMALMKWHERAPRSRLDSRHPSFGPRE